MSDLCEMEYEPDYCHLWLLTRPYSGSSGGALAPFITGIMAQKLGTEVLHPICLLLFVVMEGCWFAMPKIERREE